MHLSFILYRYFFRIFLQLQFFLLTLYSFLRLLALKKLTLTFDIVANIWGPIFWNKHFTVSSSEDITLIAQSLSFPSSRHFYFTAETFHWSSFKWFYILIKAWDLIALSKIYISLLFFSRLLIYVKSYHFTTITSFSSSFWDIPFNSNYVHLLMFIDNFFDSYYYVHEWLCRNV